ncbi:MAG: hypothetical protein Q7S53_01865 [bacterium]|nr:hypothetical protein [bacterium]
MKEFSNISENKDVAEQPLEVEISSGDTKVAVCPEVGGMVTRFSIGNQEILYFDQDSLTEEAVTEKRKPKLGVPFLFPISGPDLKDGILRQHGGAREVPWVWQDQNEDSVEVSLKPKNIKNEQLLSEYRKKYGNNFDFTSDVKISVSGKSMQYSMEFQNMGDKDLPMSPGLHPYFGVDHDKQGEIETNLGDIDFGSRDWDEGAVICDRPVGEDAWFTLPGVGKVTIESSPEFEKFVVWSKKREDNTGLNENYICIEPWVSTPDEESGIVLDPMEKKKLSVKFSISELEG